MLRWPPTPDTGGRHSDCPRWITKPWRDRCRTPARGSEHVADALAAGRGAILALPHSGNWDIAGVWLTNTYGKFTTVAERLKPESLYQRFVDYRESLGFEVLPLTGGARPPFEVLAERLRDNRLVCLMSDRDLTRSGVQVDFFGEPTRFPAGPAKLAVETGAALLPIHSWYEAEGLAARPLRAAGHVVGRRRRHHPGARGPLRHLHRRPSRRLAHASAAVARRPVRGAAVAPRR